MGKVCVYDEKKRKRIEIIDIIVILLILGLSIFILIKYNLFNEKLSEEVIKYGLFGVFIMAFLFEMFPQLLHPFLGVILATGIGINVFLATFVAILGSLAGSLAGFEIGRRYGFNFICPLFSIRFMKKILYFWDGYGNIFVLISAILPVPYVPLVFGSLGMKRRMFLFYGVIPRTLIFIALGLLLRFGINIIGNF